MRICFFQLGSGRQSGKTLEIAGKHGFQFGFGQMLEEHRLEIHGRVAYRKIRAEQYFVHACRVNAVTQHSPAEKTGS